MRLDMTVITSTSHSESIWLSVRIAAVRNLLSVIARQSDARVKNIIHVIIIIILIMITRHKLTAWTTLHKIYFQLHKHTE